MNILQADTFPLQGKQLIEASAGTGKTYTITSLYLRLLLQNEDDQEPRTVSQILVLTFTIAATDELRLRIRERIIIARDMFSGEACDDPFILELFKNSLNTQRDKRLLTNALKMMDEASIFTIHGFCARVLSEQSFETGMLFSQRLDGDKKHLQIMAAEDCFRRNILTLKPYSQSLALSLWPTPERLLQALSPYLSRTDLKIIPSPVDNSERLLALLNEISECKEIWIQDNIGQLVHDCEFNKRSRTFTRLNEMQNYAQSTSMDISVWEHWAVDALSKATKKTGTTQPVHNIFERINKIWNTKGIIEQEVYNLWHSVLKHTKDNLEGYKVQSSQLTMDDLLSTVHEALNASTNQAEILAETLRQKWPVALIDEFQDTDNLQYQIFSKIYPENIFFIGDPKQAIYQFRGADIFTYINAKRDIPQSIYSLDTNWRSSQSMIKATNFLFQQENIFGNDKDIPFEPVKVAEKNINKYLTISGKQIPPVQIYTGEVEGLSTESIRQNSMDYAAEQVAIMLNSAAIGETLVNGKPLEAGQIAFLVRSHNDAAMARTALADRGIKSVYLSHDSVLDSDTAEDLTYILQAVLEPTNVQNLKSALATPLLQFSVSEIDSLKDDLEAHQLLLVEFTSLQKTWRESGVAVMIGSLIESRGLGEKWLEQAEGERQLTNLRHLGELLQHESHRLKGMHQLVTWFGRPELYSGDQDQIRLESDSHLVQIVTMHSAKGLEYDVVMIPVACYGNQQYSKNKPVLFHQQTPSGIETVLDLSADENHRHLAIAEMVAEDMRLLYVAITRARYLCFLGLTLFKKAENTAFARLLQIEDATLDTEVLLSQLPESLFEIKKIETAGNAFYESKNDRNKLSPPPSIPITFSNWRVHSYSALANQIHQIEETILHDEPGFGDDDKNHTDSQPAPSQELNRFTFPRGPKIGVALHDMLEVLNFSGKKTEWENAAQRLITKISLQNHSQDSADHTIQMVSKWIEDILSTPMSKEINFALKGITSAKRLNELEFYFPVRLDHHFFKALQDEGYLSQSTNINIGRLEGMMTGFIDLTVEYEGRFYLIDYKSNHLGTNDQAYTSDKLQEAISHHQYDLQYLIYHVALMRYLKSKLANFNFDTHMGGVCYLFLRGMSGQPGAGVFFDKPSEQLILKLDKLLSKFGGLE